MGGATRRGCRVFASCLLLSLMGCGGDELSDSAVMPMMSLDADLTDPTQFYDAPFPSDTRLTAEGTPSFEGFPNPSANPTVSDIREIAGQRPGFATTSAGYFRFDGAIAPPEVDPSSSLTDASAVWLIDVDPSSPERGRRFAATATLLEPDDYTPENLLAVAGRPGIVLTAGRTYAYVLTNALTDTDGKPVGRASALDSMPSLEPLWETLNEQGLDPSRVVAATVFTTGDVVVETARLSDLVVEKYEATIQGLNVDEDDGATHERFCELHGTVTFPQFQRGTTPFDTEGLFDIDESGEPALQGQAEVPMVITLPKEPMPKGGYPFVMYFHGSGGVSTQVVDRGRIEVVGGQPRKGEGPSHVLAAHGFAAVGSAHPVNPERVPGAGELQYINFNNLPAFRDTFRQGVIEQRLYLDALLALEISPETVAGCEGMSLPEGESNYRLSDASVLAMGQSMGAMYTNLIGAVEPRIDAVVPTGAGGYWSYFLLETSLVPAKGFLPLALGSTVNLHYLHPAMQLLQTGWEPAEPMVYMPRLARRPLDGHAPRDIYQPVGKDDEYFPMTVFDAVTLAYGHQQAGEKVWPEMQEALALSSFDGFGGYPVSNNRTSSSDEAYTGVVVQYLGDGIYDPHSIFAQLDTVKYQYGCFFELHRETKTAVVLEPKPLGTPCK